MKSLGSCLIGFILGLVGFPLINKGEFSFVNLLVVVACVSLWVVFCKIIEK